MFALQELSDIQLDRCVSTVSSNAFYLIVANALLRKKALSVVRMGDGEKFLLGMCEGKPRPPVLTDKLLEDLGCLGIEDGELYSRIIRAGTECSWFAPSISGITRDDFSLYEYFPRRNLYVDNFWCNAWDENMKIELFKLAKHVLFIHRNTSTADAMQIRAKYGIGVKVTYLKLENWTQSESVIEKAQEIDAPLVLFSAGPASKYIGNRIATSGRIPKVALDLGHAADQWTLPSLLPLVNGRR